jgi:methionine--tRNA ligase beta chain
LDLLDIRVGKVLRAWKHPEADSLYVEEVDIGDPDGPRTICSGLVKYVSQEALEGRSVVVLANLKARNMRGVKSNGMLLCASDAAHENVELLSPPEGALPGERIWFGSEEDKANQKAAAAPNQVQKKKIWESIQPLLKTTEECAAVFQDKAMRASAGIITCASLKGGNVS